MTVLIVNTAHTHTYMYSLKNCRWFQWTNPAVPLSSPSNADCVLLDASNWQNKLKNYPCNQGSFVDNSQNYNGEAMCEKGKLTIYIYIYTAPLTLIMR